MRFTSDMSKKSHKISAFARILFVTIAILLVASIASGPQAEASDEPHQQVIAEAQSHPQQQLRGESELPWLFAVYIITWGAFFVYVFIMSRRQREMRREIDALNRAMAERERREAEEQS